MEVCLKLDSRSWEVINHLANFQSSWHKHMYTELPKELAKKAEEYFKPMLAVRDKHTGQLERSIRHEVRHNGDGWEVNYFGLAYGLFVDLGNFPPDDVRYARDYGLKAFPVDQRLGEPRFLPYIHGMGAYTPGAPTHYSEKTVEWLANGPAVEVAYEHLMAFLSEVVS